MAYLIRKAHVVDPQVGLDDVLDVLVDGAKIAQVAKNIDAPGATVVDAGNKYLSCGHARPLPRSRFRV